MSDKKGIYDSFHEETYYQDELFLIYDKYLTWCHNNNQDPEVTHIKDIDESNIAHVAYHANLVGSNGK
jgi:hypothetical protein